jgi:8-oxo-dGTP pyrophosphatase MutT (NUDIX family)
MHTRGCCSTTAHLKGTQTKAHTLPIDIITSFVPVQGYFNGFGGKVEQGETVTEAAHREVQHLPT